MLDKLFRFSVDIVSLSRRNFLMISGAGLASALAFDPLRKASRVDAKQPILSDKYGALRKDPNGLLDLPEGFQTSEFLLDHGFLDFIVERKDLRDKLDELLSFFQTAVA